MNKTHVITAFLALCLLLSDQVVLPQHHSDSEILAGANLNLPFARRSRLLGGFHNGTDYRAENLADHSSQGGKRLAHRQSLPRPNTTTAQPMSWRWLWQCNLCRSRVWLPNPLRPSSAERFQRLGRESRCPERTDGSQRRFRRFGRYSWCTRTSFCPEIPHPEVPQRGSKTLVPHRSQFARVR